MSGVESNRPRNQIRLGLMTAWKRDSNAGVCIRANTNNASVCSAADYFGRPSRVGAYDVSDPFHPVGRGVLGTSDEGRGRSR